MLNCDHGSHNVHLDSTMIQEEFGIFKRFKEYIHSCTRQGTLVVLIINLTLRPLPLGFLKYCWSLLKMPNKSDCALVAFMRVMNMPLSVRFEVTFIGSSYLKRLLSWSHRWRRDGDDCIYVDMGAVPCVGISLDALGNGKIMSGIWLVSSMRWIFFTLVEAWKRKAKKKKSYFSMGKRLPMDGTWIVGDGLMDITSLTIPPSMA